MSKPRSAAGWVFLAVLAGGVAAGTLWVRSWPDAVRNEEEQPAPAPVVPDAIAEYLTFADGLGQGSGGPELEHLAEGLRRLAGAMGRLGAGDAALPIDLRVAAEHLLLDPRSVQNAAIVRDRLIAVADALAAAGDGERLRMLAQAIDGGTPLPDQRAALDEFFRACADAIRRAPAAS